MNKKGNIMVYVVVIGMILIFSVLKTITTSEKNALIVNSAIRYCESRYENVDFEMLSWNYNRQAKNYTVNLVDVDNKNIQLSCLVDPKNKKDGLCYVEIFAGRNIEIE